MDLPLRSLSRVTVEAVQEGWVFAPRRLRVPPCLRAELLAYAGEQGIGSGPVFCTRYGKLMDRGNINVRIQSLARDARVSAEKCNPGACENYVLPRKRASGPIWSCWPSRRMTACWKRSL